MVMDKIVIYVHAWVVMEFHICTMIEINMKQGE